MEQVTIQGEVFNIDTPYTEGHTLTAGEAAALNQVRHENLRNNFAKRVKDAKEAGTFSLDAFQAQLDEIANQYEFGAGRRSASGGAVRTSDPVKREAMKIAVEYVTNRLKAKGKTIGPKGDHTNAQVREAAEKLLPQHQEWMETARERVEQNKALAEDGEDIDIESLMGDELQEAA